MRIRALTVVLCLAVLCLSTALASSRTSRGTFKKLKNLKYLVKWAPPTCNRNRPCPAGQCCSVYQPTLHTVIAGYCKPTPGLGDTCRLGSATQKKSFCECPATLKCVPAYRHLVVSGRSLYKSRRGTYTSLDEEVDIARDSGIMDESGLAFHDWDDVNKMYDLAEKSSGALRRRTVARLASVGICIRRSSGGSG